MGDGGTASVYSVPSLTLGRDPEQAWVYKKYKAAYRPVSLFGMQSLVRLLDRLEPGQRRAFRRSLNWPERVVIDSDHGAAGLILPMIPDEFFTTIRLSNGTRKRKSQEAQFLMMDRTYCARVAQPYADEEQRRHICRSLCYAMALLHRAEVVYGDLSSRNILFRLKPRPAAMLVDCDAVRLSGAAAAFGRQPHSPDWEPPEAIRARRRGDSGWTIQSKETDLYKLGLAILRILAPGDSSSTNTDPTRVKPVLPFHLYTLLERALSSNPADRPSAKTWYQELIR